MSTPTFIVGTGRCGSTMLSNMLREHPRVLSLSEFFAMVVDNVPDPFPEKRIDGQEFWSMVASTGPFASFALRQGIAPPEYLYNFNAPAARFSAETGVPSILITTLPHLTAECDALFEALAREVIAWPLSTAGQHYRHLFDWLTGHFGKRIWVERSAITLHLVRQLVESFPDARFIHIVRDGRDAVLSMREHLAFRLLVVLHLLGESLGVDPLSHPDRSRIDSVPVELRQFLPEQFDAEGFRAFRLPILEIASNWFHQVSAGLMALAALPKERLLTLRYEDILADPKERLDSFAAFLGEEFVDEGWSTRCAATVHKPRSSWRDLPEEEGRALTDACRLGFEALAAAGVKYDY